MKKTIYLAYMNYKNKAAEVSPAGQTVVEYTIKCLCQRKQPFVVVSAAIGNSEYERVEESNAEGMTVILPKSSKSHKKRNLIGRIFDKAIRERRLYNELLKQVQDFDTLLVHYSLGTMRIIEKIRKKKNIKLVLQVCEIYSDVNGNKKSREKEIKFIEKADAYIFWGEGLKKELNKNNKPCCICLGDYTTQKEVISKKANDKIHIVYAGTLDPQKGGALAAVKTAEFLDDKYHIHILGFGSEAQLESIKKAIGSVANIDGASVSYDGCLSGDEYISFLQSCHIGLSTQNPNAAFNETSFPSKIIIYLANDLRVISAKISVVENSPVGSAMIFYEEQSPLKIAQAIKSIDIKDDYDGRAIINRLDEEFKIQFNDII